MSMEGPRRGAEGLPDDSFRRVLDEQGVRIIESGVSIPPTLNEAAIATLPEPAARWLTGALLPAVRSYLAMPTFVDSYTSHEDRRVWRDNMERQYPGFKLAYERNKLKRNNIGSVRPYLEQLVSMVEGMKGNLPDAIRAAYAELPDVFPANSEQFEDNFAGYEQMSTEEKIDVVRRTEHAIHTLLGAIAGT